MTIPIKEYFTYHPPTTERRKLVHESINKTALEFAQLVESVIEDEDSKKQVFNYIQMARMFANQGAVLDELKNTN